MVNIRDLERKYMEEIWKWASSKEFSKDLINIESFIQKNYVDLKKRYQKKNKLDIAAERLLNFYVHKRMNVKSVYPSPISSDLAFFTDDALVNIDAKTIDLDGNEGDDSFIQFNPHQITFFNKSAFARDINGNHFSGISFPPGLPESENNFPCLTFFLGITYRDDNSNFSISHIKLSCVPHKVIVSEDYNDDLIKNLKTYRYLKKEEAERQGDAFLPKPTKDGAPEHWIPFPLKGTGKNDAWLDPSLNNPFNGNELVFWKVIDKKYHVCLGPTTARIVPKKVKKRKDDSGNEWDGVRSLDVIRA